MLIHAGDAFICKRLRNSSKLIPIKNGNLIQATSKNQMVF
jgi:hypothetical protein